MARTKKVRITRQRKMRFEAAMKYLRTGRSICREAWQTGNRIFRVDENIFVLFAQADRNNTPSKWEPYPQDFLAEDWMVFDKAPEKRGLLQPRPGNRIVGLRPGRTDSVSGAG